MWDKKHTFSFPTSIRFGPGVIDELPEYLVESGYKRPMIVSDATLTSLDFFEKLLKRLKTRGLSPSIYSKLDKNPKKTNVLDGKVCYLESASDCIIGLGGGASMDVARAMALWAYHDRDLFDFDDAIGGDANVKEKIPLLICVPTTSGTGSEVGRSCVISDDITHEKKVLFSPRLMAKQVFADPELTLNLPPNITATTGMDALTHNIEAYVAKGLHPICDAIALEGIRLVSESLEQAVNSPTVESRSKMMMASLMGATAFQKGLGVVHSLSHALSTKFDIHHGLANAILLEYGIEFNWDSAQERYMTISKAVNTQDLKYWVRTLNKKIGINETLASVGVGQKSLSTLAKLAYNDNCHKLNPRVCSMQDLEQIYKKALQC